MRFVALCPQGGESISHQEMLQYFSGCGRVQIATLSRLQDAFLYGWNFFSSSRMLNWTLKGFLHWFRHLQQGQYIRLLVWWLSRRGINPWCNPCTMEATVIILSAASEPLILSVEVRSMELYTFIRWCRGPIACGGTSATRLTWLLSICCTCRLFDSMLEVIVAAIYTNLTCVYSGCFNFCNGSCGSLYIIDVARD